MQGGDHAGSVPPATPRPFLPLRPSFLPQSPPPFPRPFLSQLGTTWHTPRAACGGYPPPCCVLWMVLLVCVSWHGCVSGHTPIMCHASVCRRLAAHHSRFLAMAMPPSLDRAAEPGLPFPPNLSLLPSSPCVAMPRITHLPESSKLSLPPSLSATLALTTPGRHVTPPVSPLALF